MSLNTLSQKLKNDRFSKFYVIYGEEDYLKKQAVDKITQKAVTACETFNLQRFDGVPEMQLLEDAVMNIPVMSEHKCVIIRDAEPKSFNADEWKKLQEILKNLPRECILIIYYDAARPSAKKDKRFASLLTLANKEGQVEEINGADDNELLQFIAKRAAENGCEINSVAARYLIDSCGDGMNNIGCELDKICALANGGKITKDIIDRLVVKPVTTNIYDLAKAVVNGRTDLAMKILDELFYIKEEPIVILSALSGKFCDLYRAKAALSAGKQQADVMKDFGYKIKWPVQYAYNDARNINIDFLAKALEILMSADRELKSTSAQPRVVFEKTLIELDRARRSIGGNRYGSY